MADPQVLYIVSAVVVLALVAWVIVVTARAPALPYARKNAETVSAGPPAPAPSPAASPASEASPKEDAADVSERKSRLDAHLEIQDEAKNASKASGSADDKAGEG
jgi:hypothetical protein